MPFCEGGKVGGNGNSGSTPYFITLTHSLKILSVTSKNDLKNHRKRISENSHAIIEEISLAENLENDRGDIILYDNGLQIRKQGQDQSDDLKLGLELTPDEQSERVNLLLLGFASIILMNAMAVLIIVFAKNSKYENQLVIKSSIIKRQIKGRYYLMTTYR